MVISGLSNRSSIRTFVKVVFLREFFTPYHRRCHRYKRGRTLYIVCGHFSDDKFDYQSNISFVIIEWGINTARFAPCKQFCPIQESNRRVKSRNFISSSLYRNRFYVTMMACIFVIDVIKIVFTKIRVQGYISRSSKHNRSVMTIIRWHKNGNTSEL